MRPILFNIGPLPIRSYGLFLFLAFVVGIELARRDAKRANLDPKAVMDVGFWLVISGIAGARIMYVLFYARDRLLHDPLLVFRTWEGGLVYWGGFLLALPTAALLCHRHGLPVLRALDLTAPSVAIGQALGRIGCFLNGCCYGVACNLPIGVKFPHLDHPVHPTQLYESAAQFVWFGILWSMRKRIKRPGALISLYVIAYSATRFAIEFLRGDGNPQFALGLTLAQWTGIFASAAVIVAWLVWGRDRTDVSSVSSPSAS